MELGVTQPVAAVNVIQQIIGWYEICGNNGHAMTMCAENPASVMFVGSAQRTNYRNAYNLKWKTQPLNQ